MTDLSQFMARILAIWTGTAPVHRRAAIEAAYDAECLFTDPDGTYSGRAGILRLRIGGSLGGQGPARSLRGLQAA